MAETTLLLHKRINIHRTTKSGCEYMIKHFWNDFIGSSFSIQMLEIFEGDGYVNGTVCPQALEERPEREDHWMKILRTKYPYGFK